MKGAADPVGSAAGDASSEELSGDSGACGGDAGGRDRCGASGREELAPRSRMDPQVNTVGPPTMAVSLPIGIWIMVSISAHTSFAGLEPFCAG